MKRGLDQRAAGATPAAHCSETGLPIFHSWHSVYFFVLVTFVLWVVLLVALTKTFS